jgi:hypothetical protein
MVQRHLSMERAIRKICKCLSLPQHPIDIGMLSKFIKDQYGSLPEYVRFAFLLLNFWVIFRGSKANITIKRWQTSKIKPFSDFVHYHRTLIAFYTFSNEKDR